MKKHVVPMEIGKYKKKKVTMLLVTFSCMDCVVSNPLGLLSVLPFGL